MEQPVDIYIPSPLSHPIALNNLDLSSSRILSDFDRRISEDFHIPEALKKRVGFWLNIYTKYDSNLHILHDADYPWVVYEVFDLKKEMQGEGAYWARYHKAKRKLNQRRAHWKYTLNRLARKKSHHNLNEDEKFILQHFRKSRHIRAAATRIRVQVGQRDHFLKGLERSAPHLENMEEIFSKHRLPLELTRVPLVESSFNIKAHSKAGAKGVWQIMPNIGRKLGLIKRGKDLRSDIYASTEVAAVLFKQKMNILKSWPLAITAYNHGPSGMRRATKALGTKDITRIIRRYDSRRFGFASQNFYPSFLAALYGERYKDLFFNKEYPQQISFVELDKLDLPNE
tara:strand:+ start:5932 stop:6954 length:1023 start_codon:yes stop_codon:yes gene_type:complete